LQAKCSICGKKYEITKIHKDYQKIAGNPDGSFICWNCEKKLKNQARKTQEPKKPI
jgi:uncharacterized protein YlaI